MRYLQHVKEVHKVSLNVKDRKILGFLSHDARMPLTQLAKHVGLSRDAVDYRIQQFEKEGVIQGYRVLVDLTKFGFTAYHIFVRLSNPSLEIERKIVEKIIRHPYVRAVIKFSGNYDYEIALVAKNIADVDLILKKLLDDFGGFLQDYDVIAIVKGYINESFPPNFSNIEIKESKRKIIHKQIDKKDIAILRIMSENACLPLCEIGGKVGLSADAVSYRLKLLKQVGVIVKFVPVINYAALSYNLYAFLFSISSFDEEKEQILTDFLLHDSNILWAVKTFGRYNVLIYLLVRDVDQLQETILKLRSLFPKQILRYENLIAYEEYKYLYFPTLLF